MLRRSLRPQQHAQWGIGRSLRRNPFNYDPASIVHGPSQHLPYLLSFPAHGGYSDSQFLTQRQSQNELLRAGRETPQAGWIHLSYRWPLQIQYSDFLIQVGSGERQQENSERRPLNVEVVLHARELF